MDISYTDKKGKTWYVEDATAVCVSVAGHTIFANLKKKRGELASEKKDMCMICIPEKCAMCGSTSHCDHCFSEKEQCPKVAQTEPSPQSDTNDNKAHYTLTGDLCQLDTMEIVLKAVGFDIVKSDVYPGFPKSKEDEFIRALNYLYQHRVQGWWNQEKALIDNKICTQLEFDKAMGRT